MEAEHTAGLIAFLAFVLAFIWSTHPPAPVKADPSALVPNVEAERSIAAMIKGKTMPADIAQILQMALDTNIPVNTLMTQTTPMEYTEVEVRDVMTTVAHRISVVLKNAGVGLRLSIVHTDSVAKSIDVYKTLFYDIVVSVYEAAHNVSLKLSIRVLQTAKGDYYIEKIRPWSMHDEGLKNGSSPCLYAQYIPLVNVDTL
jgi:hypothetical protein